MPSDPAPTTFYDAVGGAETFRRLIAAFYAGVAEDPILRPLYPEEDLGPAEERFRLFLEQYWGGPHTYSERRGHPRLRMRHAPFRISVVERDAWLRRMRDALDTIALAPEHDSVLWDYLVRAADFMVNDFGPAPAENLVGPANSVGPVVSGRPQHSGTSGHDGPGH